MDWIFIVIFCGFFFSGLFILHFTKCVLFPFGKKYIHTYVYYNLDLKIELNATSCYCAFYQLLDHIPYFFCRAEEPVIFKRLRHLTFFQAALAPDSFPK